MIPGQPRTVASEFRRMLELGGWWGTALRVGLAAVGIDELVRPRTDALAFRRTPKRMPRPAGYPSTPRLCGGSPGTVFVSLDSPVDTSIHGPFAPVFYMLS